jgi:hypothetical protein
MASEYSHRIVNPDLRWNGVEQPNIKSISYNWGYNKTLVDVISSSHDRKLVQREPPEYSGEFTVAQTQETATDWHALANSDTEGRVSIKKNRSQRILFTGVSIGQLSSGDDGRELSVSFVARAGDTVG